MKMKALKRILAGTSAIAVLFSTCINSGSTAIAETSDPGESIFSVNVPDGWTNTIENWIESSDDLKVYYKISDQPRDLSAWGSYTDSDAREWTDNADLSETDDAGDYIKFWAVKDDKVQNDSEAVRFYFDKTAPNDFTLIKDGGENSDLYTLHSNDTIADSLSGINAVYYSITLEYNTVDEIESNAFAVDYNTDRDRIHFSIICSKEMTGNMVFVYVIDNAGNIQKSSITVDSYMDTSAPSLSVEGIDSNSWVNKETRNNTWNIYTDSKGAKIYYATSAEDLGDEWGSYADATEWSKDAVIPEGERYIHFWAAYASPNREVAEETRFYKYDSTCPESFVVKSDHIDGHYDFQKGEYIKPQFIINGSGIYDSTSGINNRLIKYTVKQGNNEWEKGTIPIDKQTVNTDGSISFSLDLSNEDWLNGVNIIFYATDFAGNETSSILDKNNGTPIQYDPIPPKILTGDNNFGIVNVPESNASIISPYSFGGEKTETLWNAVYANDKEHYLKIVINDNNLSKIIINVDDAENGIEFSEDGKETQGRKWICTSDFNENTKIYFIKISDLGLSSDKNHDITVKAYDGRNSSEVVDLTINSSNKETKYALFYDPDDNKDSLIDLIPSIAPATENDNNYYGTDYEKNIIHFDISDDNGLKEYSVKINGTEVVSTDLSKGKKTTGTYTTVVTTDDGVLVTNEDGETVTNVVSETYFMPVDKTKYTIPLEKGTYELFDFTEDGRYEIVVSADDLAGNKNEETYSFIIDKTAPVIENCQYEYNKSLLKYFSFGLFGNESYKISIKAADPALGDNAPGIGIESVVLNWNSKIYEGTYNAEADLYEFEALPIGYKDILSIVITDKLGNSANYCMASADDHNAEIKLNEGKGDIPLVLENTPPTSGIIPPETFKAVEGTNDELVVYKQVFEDDHIEWWYPNDIEYQVYAQDKGSGLYSVNVNQNNEKRAEETKYENKAFNEDAFNDKVSYSYMLKDEGDYTLFVYAVDNAQNSNKERPLPEQTAIIHIDKTDPKITEFQFGGETDPGDTVERATYGFFFMEDTEVRVYIEDSGISSGFNNVALHLSNVNGENKSFTKAASSFEIDQDGRIYASFTIEKGFKGKVVSVVTDNVGHSSGFINANGNIVEDAEIHSSTSSIEIMENEPAKQNDAQDVPLYNISIPVTVSVIDTFSGINRIEWSIADDNESGIIEVDSDGNYINVSGDAQIIEDTIERDQNLITKLQFVIIVDSNTNGNTVRVSFTDRSGNSTNGYEKSYSIDTTAPEISASLGEGKAINDFYYNTDKTITVSIKERNFDPSAVVVKVNNDAQPVHWNEQAASVTDDETVHVGTFTLNTDGEYDFSISYTDMAGNYGNVYTQSRFVIDKTSPKISNNFDSFGSVEDENIYYNISQKDKAKAEITVNETNFYPDDMHITVYYQPAGSKHSDIGANWNTYYYSSDWKDDGNGKHTLIIPFTEDGVYKITMSPVDRAGNAGDFSKGMNSKYPSETSIFEADYTAPIIVSRDNKSVKSDDIKFYDLYDFERRNDAAPTVVFEDTNIDHIVCDGQKYTPVYSNGREIGEIKPEDISSKSNESVTDAYVPQMIYTLDNFTTDGVYSAKLKAYDKAGNASILNDNTYVRMVDPTAKVLAYIENSSRKNMEGWYSFEDENGPISKQPGSFSDLSIVVFSKKSNDTHIYLVDKETNEPTDTHITDSKDALFDEDMFEMGAYRYILPGEYFEKNYTADADTNLYLRVENNGGKFDLGELYIDNTDPNCNILEHFHDWGWFKGSGNQTLVFDNISEVLDINQTVAYVDGQTISLSNIVGNETSPFSYDEKNNKLSLTLEPGSHKVGLLLVDRAGNTKSISEVQHLAIGNYRIWIGVGFGLGAILLALIAVFVVKRVKRRRLA